MGGFIADGRHCFNAFHGDLIVDVFFVEFRVVVRDRWAILSWRTLVNLAHSP